MHTTGLALIFGARSLSHLTFISQIFVNLHTCSSYVHLPRFCKYFTRVFYNLCTKTRKAKVFASLQLSKDDSMQEAKKLVACL